MTWETACTARIPLRFSDVCAPSISARLGPFCLSLTKRPRSRESWAATAAARSPFNNSKRARPRLGRFDKLFWVAMKNMWLDWRKSLFFVTLVTVVRWHRAGFRLYWRWISRARHRVGRKPISREVREQISAWSHRTRPGEHPDLQPNAIADANLLALGAILHHRVTEEPVYRTIEGGRTTAAGAAFGRREKAEIHLGRKGKRMPSKKHKPKPLRATSVAKAAVRATTRGLPFLLY
jgi:hypothetical protein